MNIVTVPADIKLAFLSAAAVLDVNTLQNLSKLSDEYANLFKRHEHSIVLPVLKDILGPTYRWALCVAVLCSELDGKGGQTSIRPEAFRRIVRDGAEDLITKRLNLDRFMLPIKARDVLLESQRSKGLEGSEPTAIHWYGFIQHFVTLLPYSNTAIFDKGLQQDLATHLHFSVSTRNVAMTFNIREHLSLFRHPRCHMNGRLFIATGRLPAEW